MSGSSLPNSLLRSTTDSSCSKVRAGVEEGVGYPVKKVKEGKVGSLHGLGGGKDGEEEDAKDDEEDDDEEDEDDDEDDGEEDDDEDEDEGDDARVPGVAGNPLKSLSTIVSAGAINSVSSSVGESARGPACLSTRSDVRECSPSTGNAPLSTANLVDVVPKLDTSGKCFRSVCKSLYEYH